MAARGPLAGLYSESIAVMPSDGVRSRDEVYCDILHFGLLHLRTAARGGDSPICEIEADHLHNIPSLIGEKNEHRHLYYYDCERTLYLERLAVQGAAVSERARFTLERYRELWAELEAYTRSPKNSH